MASNPIYRIVFTAVVLLATSRAALAAPPAGTFTRPPAVRAVSISPDGRNLIYLSADEKGHYGMAGVDLTTMVPFAMTLDGDDIYDFTWLTDESVAFNVAMNRRWARGLYTYKLGAKAAEGISERDLTEIVSVLRDDRTRMYVWYTKRATGRRHGLALVDIDRRPSPGMGRLDEDFMVVRWVPEPPGEILGWRADRTGQVRIGVTFHEGSKRAWIHEKDGDRWEELGIDPEHTSIIAFTFDGRSLYVLHDDGASATDSIRLFDLESRTLGPVLFNDPEFGLEEGRLLGAWKDRTLVGVRFARDGLTTRWLSERFEKYQAAIDEKLPGRVNHISSWDEAESRLVVTAQSDRAPAQFFLYTVDSGSLMALPSASPWIDPVQMQPMQTVRFKARDGLPLQGYLTLPKARTDGVKPALVVYPHGGPWVRDEWGWDSTVQFLASRGYAVFQPNYRGSSGFKAEVSGERSDFRAMFDDVIDGTNLVARSGLVDPQRVAIYGGSFGGFLALAGAAFEPDRFKCVVSFAGVFDWAKLVDQSRFKRGVGYLRFLRRRDVGDPRTDAEHFASISPIGHAASIKVPVLLVHGARDDRVEDEQTKDLVRVLKQNRVKYETMFFKDEGHGFADPENAAKFLKKLEGFLAQHL